MHKIVLKVAVELSATFLLGARIASIASFIETFKGSLISEFFRFGQIQKKSAKSKTTEDGIGKWFATFWDLSHSEKLSEIKPPIEVTEKLERDRHPDSALNKQSVNNRSVNWETVIYM